MKSLASAEERGREPRRDAESLASTEEGAEGAGEDKR